MNIVRYETEECVVVASYVVTTTTEVEIEVTTKDASGGDYY